MNERNTFLLTVGSTLAIAWFGTIGALYVEILKEDNTRSLTAISFNIVGVLIIRSTYCIMFYSGIKKNRRK